MMTSSLKNDIAATNVSLRGSTGPALQEVPELCPICSIKFKKNNINSLRVHFVRIHSMNAEQTYLYFRENPQPCEQCKGKVKFYSIEYGYEKLCGSCNKKNSQLRGAERRRSNYKLAWNNGLTKETNESVRLGSLKAQEGVKRNGHWHKGHTKENHEPTALAAIKFSESLRLSWKNGTHGLIGKNASNHEGIRKRGEAISHAFLTTDKHWSHKTDAIDVIKRAIATRRAKIISGEINPLRMSIETIEYNCDVIKQNWILEDFKFVGYKTPIRVMCITCSYSNTFPFITLYNGKLCPKCYPTNYSKWHHELYDFFVSLDSNAIVNDRNLISPFELDVVSSDQKFAIECNGLYWHSEAVCTDTKYHQNKSNHALQNNISLLHVFEDEWLDLQKREIIKSMIKVKLGKAQRIFARNLKLCNGESKIVEEFLEKNHLDGSVKSSKAFWLEDLEGNIVCALTLRKPFQQSKWGEKTIEVARIATINNVVVVGGMSRLIKAAKTWCLEENYETLITYRDVRLGGSGVAYETAGFEFKYMTSERFWWTNGRHRIDRFAIRSIPGIATQEEMAMDHKMFKIFGCSNAVYVMKIKNEKL
jgi:hypothetical protein